MRRLQLPVYDSSDLTSGPDVGYGEFRGAQEAPVPAGPQIVQMPVPQPNYGATAAGQAGTAPH